MGFCRSVFNALLGPFLIYAALMAHVTYNHFVQEAPPLSMTDFGADVPKDLREATIRSRKPLIKAHLQAFACDATALNYVDTILTDDATFEDPIQTWEGKKDLRTMFKMCQGLLESNDYDIRGEHHGPNEIVLDMTMSIVMKVFGTKVGPVSLPMRQRIMLEPASKPGAQEKIFAIREDWGGNLVISEESAAFKPLGRVHKMLRRFMGFIGVKAVETFSG